MERGTPNMIDRYGYLMYHYGFYVWFLFRRDKLFVQSLALNGELDVVTFGRTYFNVPWFCFFGSLVNFWFY